MLKIIYNKIRGILNKISSYFGPLLVYTHLNLTIKNKIHQIEF